MSTELQLRDAASQIERVLIAGDLASLKPEDRVNYYKMVCDSVGLNPLTKPFEYIVLNGRLTLYARKDCTDQLRKIHNISITISAREIVDDCYVVTARATNPAGRTDESIGAVSLGTLKGEARCNAMMKGETKAKRRVTLSMCGLGMLDETEIETIPSAKKPVEVTTEDIVIGAPGKEPALEQRPVSSPNETEALADKLTAMIPAGNDYISKDDAIAIHVYARGLLNKDIQKNEKKYTHEWCKAHDLVDENGEGTLMKVKKIYRRANGTEESGIERARQALAEVMKDRNAEAIQ